MAKPPATAQQRLAKLTQMMLVQAEVMKDQAALIAELVANDRRYQLMRKVAVEAYQGETTLMEQFAKLTEALPEPLTDAEFDAGIDRAIVELL